MVKRYICPLAAIALAGALSAVPAVDPGEPLDGAIVRGLRWYFHWEKALPLVKLLNCRVQNYGSDHFVYCNPGRVTLDLTTEGSSQRINVISTTAEEFPTLSRLFAKSHASSEAGIVYIPVNADNVAGYEVDRAVSAERMRSALSYMKGSFRVYAERGKKIRLMFPLVAKSDPFYEVYLIDGSRLDSVWLFPVLGSKLQDHPCRVYDLPHRDVPDLAQFSMEDPSRWYESVSDAYPR